MKFTSKLMKRKTRIKLLVATVLVVWAIAVNIMYALAHYAPYDW